MKEIKNKVEAILFSVGSKMNLDELSALTKVKSKDKLKDALTSLQKDYDDRSSPMMLMGEEDAWKLSIRDNFLPLVNNLINDTELTKSVMETLAVIAWKYPCLQSEIIKIRTNKAYDHMSQLEQSGFISRTKFSRTKKVGLTDKFFQYFDLPRESFKRLFKEKMTKKAVTKVNQTEDEIDQKIGMIQQYEENKQEFKKQIVSKKEIDAAIMQASTLETYGEQENQKTQVVKEEKTPKVEPYGDDSNVEVQEQQEINQEIKESMEKEEKELDNKEEIQEQPEETKEREEVKQEPKEETKPEEKQEPKPEEETKDKAPKKEKKKEE